MLVSSDHGDMLGSHGQRLKRKPWEESIRVPGILRYPRRVKAGRIEEALFSHIDFAPTLLALCGARVPKSMQGANLADLVLRRSRRAPDSVFFQIFGPYAGDRTEDGWRVQGSMQTDGAIPVRIPNLDLLYDRAWRARFMTLEMKQPDDVIVHVAVVGTTTRTDTVRSTQARFRSNSVSPDSANAAQAA